MNAILHHVANHTDLLREQPAFPPTSSRERSSWWPLRRHREQPTPQSAPSTSRRREFSLFGLVYSLDFGSWELTSVGGTAADGGNFSGPTFCHRFDGALCEGQLVIGEGHPSLQETAETLASLDDRKRYDHLRKFAQAFERACGQGLQIEIENRGLHLVQLDPRESCKHRTHAAFTSRLGGRVTPHWQRRYSIAVTHPVSGTLLEFAFTFDLFGSFDTFLRHAFSMDRVVTSLRCHAP